MVGSERFLSHIAYSVGAARPIDSLRETDGLSSEILMAFRQRGLRDFRDDTRSVADMCVASALETLRDAKMSPSQLDSIVVASSNADAVTEDDDETALFAALHSVGFERGRILGLTLQACSACGDALRVAGGLVGNGGVERPVLVILFGQKRKTSRLGPQTNLVFSDGAASCLVSAHQGTFEICASESVTNTYLAGMGRAGNIAQFQGGLMELRDISRRVCEISSVCMGEIRALLGTNAGIGHLQLMAQAVGIAGDRIYLEDIPRFSHVHSCDNLISLRHYAEKHTLTPGDLFLLLSWSPHVVSATVLRRCR
jgi:3-oxoacyl-[acyl-carrier-protein] synthase III